MNEWNGENDERQRERERDRERERERFRFCKRIHETVSELNTLPLLQASSNRKTALSDKSNSRSTKAKTQMLKMQACDLTRW